MPRSAARSSNRTDGGGTGVGGAAAIVFSRPRQPAPAQRAIDAQRKRAARGPFRRKGNLGLIRLGSRTRRRVGGVLSRGGGRGLGRFAPDRSVRARQIAEIGLIALQSKRRDPRGRRGGRGDCLLVYVKWKRFPIRPPVAPAKVGGDGASGLVLLELAIGRGV